MGAAVGIREHRQVKIAAFRIFGDDTSAHRHEQPDAGEGRGLPEAGEHHETLRFLLRVRRGVNTDGRFAKEVLKSLSEPGDEFGVHANNPGRRRLQ